MALKFFKAVAFAAAAALGACSLFSGPRDALSRFLKAEQAGHFEEAYSYVSAEDSSVKSLAAYLKEKLEDRQSQGKLHLLPALDLFQDKNAFEIRDLKAHGDRAEAEVSFRVPDAGAMMKAILGENFAAAMADATSALTAPCPAINPASTCSSRIFASFE